MGPSRKLGAWLATSLLGLIRKHLLPALLSPTFRFVVVAVLLGFGFHAAYRSVSKRLMVRIPDALEVHLPGNMALEASIEGQLREEARNAKKRKQSRSEFLGLLSQTIARYPAIASATVHSRLDGSLLVSAELHTPAIEVRDRAGRRFVFGSQLAPIHSSPLREPTREPIEGLGSAPITLTLTDTELRWDRQGKTLLRSQNAGMQAPVNVAWYHLNTTALVLTIERINASSEKSSQIEIVPPGAFYAGSDEGLSFCIVIGSQKMGTDIPKSCTKVTLGPSPHLSEFQATMGRLAKNPSASAPGSAIDLRIQGRAIIRNDIFAEGTATTQ